LKNRGLKSSKSKTFRNMQLLDGSGSLQYSYLQKSGSGQAT